MQMTPIPFRGAKIALLHQGQLIAYQRDQKPEIPFPGMWDLPGGGREDDESPQECAIRETREEFDIRINPEWIVWERYYPAQISNDPGSYFLVAKLENGFGTIRFSDEGQQWAAMSVEDFLEHSEVVESLKSRLRDYLSQTCLT
jgi:8-oxo-dGTP diphosphatase